MPLKILIVDDATFIRDMMKRVLRQQIQDVEILEAADGVRAVSIIKSSKPDIILSDWEMPQMSGDELLKWVRSVPEHSDTPFVMITSRGDRDHVVKAVQAGVNDYLCKPFTSEELQKKITKQLKRLGHHATGRAGSSSGGPFSSLDILTGGKATKQLQAEGESKASVASEKPVSAMGKALIRFPNTSYECDIQDLTLQAMNATMHRSDSMPTVFEQAVVDILDDNGDPLARLNAYIHAISGTQPSPDCEHVRVILRFVDQDPKKLEALSHWINK